MRQCRAPFIGLGIALLTVTVPVRAQAPDPGDYSEARYELEELRGVMVPMRDGVRLSLDIYQPKSVELLPSVLVMTPYDNSGPRNNDRKLARRGYVVVLADVRGRYDSEGDWDPLNPKHKTDG